MKSKTGRYTPLRPEFHVLLESVLLEKLHKISPESSI